MLELLCHRIPGALRSGGELVRVPLREDSTTLSMQLLLGVGSRVQTERALKRRQGCFNVNLIFFFLTEPLGQIELDCVQNVGADGVNGHAEHESTDTRQTEGHS